VKFDKDTPRYIGVSVSKSHDFWVSTRQFFSGNRSIKAEAAMMLALAEVKCDQILGCKFSMDLDIKIFQILIFSRLKIYESFVKSPSKQGSGNDILSQMIP